MDASGTIAGASMPAPQQEPEQAKSLRTEVEDIVSFVEKNGALPEPRDVTGWKVQTMLNAVGRDDPLMKRFHKAYGGSVYRFGPNGAGKHADWSYGEDVQQ
jgi:hypothetical protein